MKNLFKSIFVLFIVSLTVLSCSRTSDEPVMPANELQDLVKIKEISNDTHIIELYSATGTTVLGYNDLKMRIKNKATNQYEKNASVSWMPLMHMAMMAHAAPRSAVTKITPDGTLYTGYIVFQMPQNASEYWDLKIDYTINGTAYSVTSTVDVPASTKTKVTSFLGTDNVKYVMAFIEPKTPKVAINDLSVGVWKMEDMMNFSVVDGYTVKVDPRMTGMGNHTSPNNVDAKQTAAGQFYKGKLSLTMTGYWKINLQLQKPDGTIVKGEEVTAANPESSLYFDFEF
ncbi:hypothetical protein [Kaistella palustris]|uniref:hypothetical protein n=1 Tax=Kaistella palustris TaxID=493376 RepID=UPI000488AD05|nr:hypothetical protein [Kaistella palustris]